MVFVPRAGKTVGQKKIELALVDPHNAKERFDPEFLLAFKCPRCQLVDMAPRKHISDAIRAHVAEDCPARHTMADEPINVRVYYPRQ